MERTHVVDRYTPVVTEGERGSDERGYQLAESAIGCNLQPASGELRARHWGREREVSWRGFLPAGTTVSEGDVLKVTAGVGPAAHEVVFVSSQGGRWDVEVELAAPKETP